MADALRNVPGVDRISQLPDAILNEILMKLPADEAGRSRTLAKRWRGLWYVGPELSVDFIEIVQGVEAEAFVRRVLTFVDVNLLSLSLKQAPFHLLPSSRNPYFEQFTLKCEPHQCHVVVPYVESWVIRLLKLGMKSLELSVDYGNSRLLSTWFAVYSCEHLVSLKLEGFFLDLPESQYMPNLKFLDVCVSDRVGAGLTVAAASKSFCQFPKLQTLVLKARLHSQLNIVLPSLLELKLYLNHGYNDNKVVIDAPALEDLMIEQNSEGGVYMVQASFALVSGVFVDANECTLHVEHNIIELPMAVEVTRAWLKEHRQLEYIGFTKFNSVFQMPQDTRLELALSSQNLHNLSATLKDSQVLKIVIVSDSDGNLEEDNSDDNLEEEDSDDDNLEEEDLDDNLVEDNLQMDANNDFIRMEGKDGLFQAERMWVEVMCYKSDS